MDLVETGLDDTSNDGIGASSGARHVGPALSVQLEGVRCRHGRAHCRL